jgi:hypothetical protein
MARIECRFREKYGNDVVKSNIDTRARKEGTHVSNGIVPVRPKKVYALYNGKATKGSSAIYSGTDKGVPMYHYGPCSPPMSQKLSRFMMKSETKVSIPEDQAKESITNLVGCSLAIMSTSVCNRVSVADVISGGKRTMEKEEEEEMESKLGRNLASRDRFDSSCRSTNSNKRICPGIFQRIIRKWEDLVLAVHGVYADHSSDDDDDDDDDDNEKLYKSLRKLIGKNVYSMIVSIMDDDIPISKGSMYNLCKLADFPEGLRVTMANVVDEMHSCVEEFRFSKTERRTAMKNLVKRVHDIHITNH